MVQKIRAQYVERECTELDMLCALDKRVRRPVNVFSYIFGSVSAIVMGAGMSLVMTDLARTLGMSGDGFVLGVIIGVVGLFLGVLNYPIHKLLLDKRKKKYAPEILAISESISNE